MILNKELLEQQLSELPLFQYAFFPTEELTFTERVRHICQEECPMYGKTWACPPAVGTVGECQNKCLAFPEFLLISTVTEVDDIANLEQTLANRADHEAITHEVAELVKAQGCETMTLSTEACAICEECAYPDGPCRFPDRACASMEAYGLFINQVCRDNGLPCHYGERTITYTSCILFP